MPLCHGKDFSDAWHWKNQLWHFLWKGMSSLWIKDIWRGKNHFKKRILSFLFLLKSFPSALDTILYNDEQEECSVKGLDDANFYKRM